MMFKGRVFICITVIIFLIKFNVHLVSNINWLLLASTTVKTSSNTLSKAYRYFQHNRKLYHRKKEEFSMFTCNIRRVHYIDHFGGDWDCSVYST